MRRLHVKDRRVWVTGASAGIGRAVSVELVRRGARVIASARNDGALAGLARECGDDRVIALPLDVTDRRPTSARWMRFADDGALWILPS